MAAFFDSLLKALQAAELYLLVLSGGWLLWRFLIAKKLEEREISQIRAREKTRRSLDRAVLVRSQILAGLDGWALLLLLYLLFNGILLRAGRADPGLRPLQLFFLLFPGVFGPLSFLWQVRNALRIRSGKYRLRRYMLSGYQASQAGTGMKRTTNYTYYMGASRGDLAVVAPAGLRGKGTWYYTVIIDGKATLALPAELWQPDHALREDMPAEDWEKAAQDK